MHYERTHDLAIGPDRFVAFAFFPARAHRKEDPCRGKDQILARFCSGGRACAFALAIVPEQRLRVCLLFYEYSSNPEEPSPDCFETLASDVEENLNAMEPAALMERIRRFAEQNLMIVNASLIQVDAPSPGGLSSANAPHSEEDHGELPYVFVKVLAAGLPPLVLIENAHFHFPVRSGIPLGVTNMPVGVQTLEMPVHSTLYMHAPLPGDRGLRRLHAMLPHFRAEELPNETIFFGLTHQAAHSS